MTFYDIANFVAESNKKQLQCLLVCVWNMLITFQINDDCSKVIMHHDVTSCVICISNEVEYPEKKGSYKNSTKEVTLSF